MKKVLLVSLVVFLATITSLPIFASDEDTANPIPTVPIILDGERMEPKKIRSFDNQILYYLVDDQAKTDGIIYVFTTLEKIQNFAAESQRMRQQQQLAGCTSLSQLFINANYGGDKANILPGTGARFTGMNSVFNNNVSSAITTSANMYTKLYDNTDYTGNQLWLASCGSTPNLDIYGWNNRAGSVKVE